LNNKPKITVVFKYRSTLILLLNRFAKSTWPNKFIFRTSLMYCTWSW